MTTSETAAAETAAALRDPIGDTGGRFMLDGATYMVGMNAGFAGLDLYVCGRCGVLGPVDADVVVAELGFFEPGNVATNWAAGRRVMPLDEAAALFMGCGYTWARAHFDPDLDAARLAELTRAVVDATGDDQPALFRAWRAVPWPGEPVDAAMHGIHLLRELRGGAHVAATRDAGIDPHTAVMVRAGAGMAELFGWSEPHPDPEPARAAWTAAEAATDDRVAAVLGILSDDEQRELVELATIAAGR